MGWIIYWRVYIFVLGIFSSHMSLLYAGKWDNPFTKGIEQGNQFSPVAPKTESNLRDQCRLEVSGMYLTIQNDVQRLHGFMKVLEARISSLDQVIIDGKNEVKKLKGMAGRGDRYGIEEEREFLVKQEKLSQLIANRESARYQYLMSKNRLNRSRAKLGQFVRRFSPIFLFGQESELAIEKESKVTYKHLCPMLDLFCPLPLEERKRLAEASVDKAFPLAVCLSYSRYSIP